MAHEATGAAERERLRQQYMASFAAAVRCVGDDRLMSSIVSRAEEIDAAPDITPISGKEFLALIEKH